MAQAERTRNATSEGDIILFVQDLFKDLFSAVERERRVVWLCRRA